MGEVRAQVIITNAVDEALARRGQIDPSAIRRYEADALIDTGAVRSIIPLTWRSSWASLAAVSVWFSTPTEGMILSM